jgi:hypothetical protein
VVSPAKLTLIALAIFGAFQANAGFREQGPSEEFLKFLSVRFLNQPRSAMGTLHLLASGGF